MSKRNIQPYLIRVDLPAELRATDQNFADVRDKYVEAVEWYTAEKDAKSRMSKALRAASIVLAVVGGAVPLLAAVMGSVDSAIGYIFLALAAGVQVLDRYFGYSSAWARYAEAALKLNGVLLEYQLEYARSLAVHASDEEKWKVIEAYSRDLVRIVNDETQVWHTLFTDIANNADYLNEGAPPERA
ncbi:SLATT domain-containing protein [Mycolicibacterium arseniciresistens]|uniref:SLATT domain-containing protein n=1 Tax=Mycolicibacterium arseniciresistens TaxID=3062257 RepID=A0ABT8UPN0_9MYCO|nr:SLATT domain-containing protein [Mycolicibacterium arseniciresistens]MDO3639754.1 SLATT domain-containing protein [Mycolicibacterium arseniciresistens]